jgi:hypothetical protein
MTAVAEIELLRSEAEDTPGPRGNPEFDLLLACCADPSSGEPPRERIHAILSHRLNWERLLSQVDHHRVVPQVYSALSASSHLIPPQHFDALRLRYRDNARNALWFTGELVRIVSYFESAGIKALPYKGPLLAQTLYGEVTHRQFGDLDILILPEDVPKAKAALQSLGYKPTLDLAPQIETAYIETGYEYSFNATNGQNLLELQWRIVPRFYSIDFDVADFFDRADEIKFGVRSMRTLRPEDLLLVLCVHAAKHAWVQLSWLCDITQLVRSEHMDWNAVQDEAHRLGIELILNLNLFLTQKLLAAPLPRGRLRDDQQTIILADQILQIIKRSGHYDTESIPYFRLMMSLRGRRLDQARFLWRLASTPSVSEWSTIPLPKPLHPLYRLVRLARLTKRLSSIS